jgi:uncharacterized protein DUF3467
MSEEKQQKPQSNIGMIPDLRKVPLETPEDGVFYAYGNVVNMNWTLTDVQFRFAELIQVPNDESPTWENQHGILLERVAVTVPWYQAKVLLDMLTKVVHNYEAVNGELKAPVLADPPKD